MTHSTHAAAILLERVSSTAKGIEAQYRENGMAYNVFKVAGISKKEVYMCRVLVDLLNPKGLHYKGSVYLKLFMDTVVNPLINKAEKIDLSNVKVTDEYTTDRNRRIDIVIDDGIVFIPIEVKIGAGEQKRQLADYADFSGKMNTCDNFIPVLFLTPNGRKSNDARLRVNKEYIPVSFEEHIIPWLEKCLNLEETDKASPLREILKQFIKAIKSFCEEERIMKSDVTAIITKSKESYAAALLIKKALDEFDIAEEARLIFEDKICNLVKSKLPDVKYLKEGKGNEEWFCLDIPIGETCLLRINFDMISIYVKIVSPRKMKILPETAEKICGIMLGLTGVRNEKKDWGEGFIWATAQAKCPGLENIDDEDKDIYNYELYKIYSKDPQSVADTIVNMAMELRNI